MKKLILLSLAGLTLSNNAVNNFIENPVSGSAALSEKEFSYNENSIYAMNDNYNEVYSLPLRAMKMSNKKFDYFLLTDGGGNFFISYDNLIDGKNYIATVVNFGKNEIIHSVIESTFVFTSEPESLLDMDNPENKEFFEGEAKFLIEKGLLNNQIW